jgi:hypothetical protein
MFLQVKSGGEAASFCSNSWQFYSSCLLWVLLMLRCFVLLDCPSPMTTTKAASQALNDLKLVKQRPNQKHQARASLEMDE